MILLGDASCIILLWFKSILDDFVLVLGGLINEGKIHVYSLNASKLFHRRILRIFWLTGRDEWTNFRYLGLPIYLKEFPHPSWVHVIEKFKSKFEQWGAHWLNLFKRLILVL